LAQTVRVRNEIEVIYATMSRMDLYKTNSLRND